MNSLYLKSSIVPLIYQFSNKRVYQFNNKDSVVVVKLIMCVTHANSEIRYIKSISVQFLFLTFTKIKFEKILLIEILKIIEILKTYVMPIRTFSENNIFGRILFG